ncbi:hypothetical protein C6N75_18180 [Streptomyces solincola]|uniref:Uncharacterized protein n=1 Tax=Streptomyces solincola TaxID=2100817 RepID=A0A2S9PTT6_9ACTN|nr:hypothetical protein [Streptomyces solincola]PRH77836.1 hypothetical protein C6N75_18180 [Streptomyces solincola]
MDDDLTPDAAPDGATGREEPGGPAALGVERTPTGYPAVDAALHRLADADHLPADGHLAVYEDVHRELREALAALDARPPGPPAPSAPTGRPSPSSYDHRS